MKRDRLEGLDLARYFAFVGMVIVNFKIAMGVDTGDGLLWAFTTALEGKDEEDARDLDRALSREVRSHWRLIVTAKGTLPLTEAQAVRLDDLVEMNAETGALRSLAQPADLAGVPRKNKGGRPSDHGAALAAIISDRMQTGTALDGTNAEVRAILADFKARHKGIPTPSASTVKRHLVKLQGGS